MTPTAGLPVGKARSHDQRKGQWLVNKVRYVDGVFCLSPEQIERKIWNMTNEKFDEIMEHYTQ